MRERLVSYVTELTSGKKNSEAILERALERYDREIAQGTEPQAALGYAISTIGEGEEPRPAPRARVRERELAIGDNRWKIRGTLRALRVNYSFGRVYVRQHSGQDTVVFEKNVDENAEPARFTFEKGVLSIEFTGKKTVRKSLEGIKDIFSPSRCLEILVPSGMASELMEVKLSSRSADFSVSNVSAEVFECETASGDVSVRLCRFESAIFSSSSGEWSSKFTDIEDLDLDTSGGDCDVRGDVCRLSFESASGDLHGVFSPAPEELEFSSASGSCKLYLPGDAGFSMGLRMGSGKTKVEGFDGFFLGSGADRRYVCGKSGGSYSVSTASGDVGVYVNYGA